MALELTDANFQEKVLMNEIKLEGGDKSINTIRELLILYSIGTEYYDSINSDMLVHHYMKKSTQIISNPDYMALIDDHNRSRELGQNTENDEAIRKRIFEGDCNKPNGINGRKSIRPPIVDKSRQMTVISKENGHYNHNGTNGVVNGSTVEANSNPFLNRFKNKTMYSSQKNMKIKENEMIVTQLKQELDSIEVKTHKAEEQLGKEMDAQLDNFHRLKLLKKSKSKKITQMAQPVIPPRRTSTGRRGSKYDIVVESLVMQGKSEKDVLLDILEHSERQMKINQELMQKEIDDFVNKSIKEMNDAIDELRLSYMEDLKEVDENVFPDLVMELKSDMEHEIEILQEKYEELRIKETDKIRAKYMKKMNN